MDQHLNKVAALLSLEYTTVSFIENVELIENLPVEVLKVPIYSQANLYGGDFLS